MAESFNIIVVALNQLAVQLAALLPKLIITLIIWWVGKYLLGLAVKLVKKVDLKGTQLDNKIIGAFSSIVLVVGKILLVLIILDYWNIGKPIISALANGLTLAVAITLGLAFGKALTPEAENIVKTFKKRVKK